jgi:hypothetical protein
MSFDLPGVKPGSDIETLFKAIGFVVVQWGFAEQSLDLMVANIFHSFDGHHLLKRRPQHLEPKLKFLEECFAEIPELARFHPESKALLPRFAVAGKKRNELVHGAISDISIEDGAFMFLKVDVKPKESHSIRSVLLAESDWVAFRKELLSLGGDGQSLARRVWDSLKVHT